MAISVTQTNTVVEAVGVTGARTLTITPTQTGSLLWILGVANEESAAADITSVRDNVDGAWTVIKARTNGTFSGLDSCSFVAYRICSSTAQRTVTITPDTTSDTYYWVYSSNEATVVDATTPVDDFQVDALTTGSSSITSSGVTATAANGLVVGVSANYVSTPNWTSPTTGWTSLYGTTNASNIQGKAVYQIDSGTNSFAPTFTDGAGGYAGASCVVVIFKAAGSGAQTLQPGLLTNSQVFYAPTVSAGAVSLAPTLVSNAQTFYNPTASSLYTLAPSLLANAQAFYGPVVSTGLVTLLPGLVTNTQVFYAPTVAQGGQQTLAPSLVANAQTFYVPTIVAQNTLLPTLLQNGGIFYSATVLTGAVTLQPTLVTAAQVFYPPTVLQQSNVELLPGLLSNTQQFFAPSVVLRAEAVGGWDYPEYAKSKTKEERQAERRRLGILPPEPLPSAEETVSTHRTAPQQAISRVVSRLPKPTAAPTAASPLPPSPPLPMMATVELPDAAALDAALVAKKRAFEQDLVYIVATLLS